MDKMKTIALTWLLGLVVANAMPTDIVFSVDQDNHKHIQRGQPGNAVRGTYQFTAADGALHVVTYVADDKGYRVVGKGKVDNTIQRSDISPTSLFSYLPPPTTPGTHYLAPPTTTDATAVATRDTSHLPSSLTHSGSYYFPPSGTSTPLPMI